MTEPIKLLTVDDDPANLEALQALLSGEGVEVLGAGSGYEALELLQRETVAVAVLDVTMPGMDGFQLAEAIRGMPAAAATPLIFLTGRVQDSHRTFRGYAAGAVDFLHKPADPVILRSKVGIFVELERQKRKLAEQLALARKLLKTNELLMAVLAHDLRTPLSAVIASASFIKRFSTEERTRPAVERIEESGKRMVRMVDQLLNIARLNGGRIQMDVDRHDLAALAEASAAEFRAREADMQGGRITLAADGDTLATFDAGLVSQVLANLVGNALRHGQAGGTVAVHVDGTDAAALRVSVHNQGVIAAADLPHLFDVFRSGGSKPAGEGLGLGLHITQAFAQLHGGRIDVTSRDVVGTTFTLTLPRGAVPDTAVA